MTDLFFSWSPGFLSVAFGGTPSTNEEHCSVRLRGSSSRESQSAHGKQNIPPAHTSRIPGYHLTSTARCPTLRFSNSTLTASTRKVSLPPQTRPRRIAPARLRARRLVASIRSSPVHSTLAATVRDFTSTRTMVSPSSATRSTSLRPTCTFRPTIRRPLRRRCRAATRSPHRPSRRAAREVSRRYGHHSHIPLPHDCNHARAAPQPFDRGPAARPGHAHTTSHLVRISRQFRTQSTARPPDEATAVS